MTTLRNISKICLAMMLTLPAFTMSAHGRGEKSLGLRGGYNTRNESAVAVLYFQYAFSRHFRLAPNVDYVFRNDGTDAYSANINTHFPIAFDRNERFAVYPFTGVNFISWNHRINNIDGQQTSSRTSRLGPNFGVGMEYYCTQSLKISIEGKFSLVKSYNSGVFNIGIGYVF